MTTIRGWLMEISIHAPRTGSDRKYHRCRPLVAISIHAPRTGSDWSRSPSPAQRFISIHAPRTGSDFLSGRVPLLDLISIHAPRTGSDASRSAASFASIPFQSTLPARGATRGDGAGGQARRNFNPRSPHGERPACCVYVPLPRDFNPRSPHGERRTGRKSLSVSIGISIHAPRTGSDVTFLCVCDKSQKIFQSTLPARGATLSTISTGSNGSSFQSTLPARGATYTFRCWLLRLGIFQSTLPARGAT